MVSTRGLHEISQFQYILEGKTPLLLQMASIILPNVTLLEQIQLHQLHVNHLNCLHLQYAADGELLPSSQHCVAVKTLAQQRRQLENEEFCMLARELPLARAISGQHIDKTTMIRLAVSYIKLHNQLLFPLGMTREADRFWSSHPLELMDSFFMILDDRGDVLYVSETISIYLGLSQVEMMGHNFAEYVHMDDWQRFQAIFLPSSASPESANVRVRSSLTKRVTKDSVRASPGYKVIRLEMFRHGLLQLCHCSPLPSLVLSTVSIQNHSFVITTALDLKIISADEKAEQVFGDSLKNRSFYHLINVEDTPIIRKLHFEVFVLGAYKTPYYRMLREQQSFFVASNVYRYSSLNCKKVTQETITIVSVEL